MSEEQSQSSANEETWNLVFFPQLEEGSDYEKVRGNLATKLKVDSSKVDEWYDAESPTVLLKGVAKEVAERYMEAILECGAACNIQASSEVGGLTLIPKSRNVDFFICPSCEYEKEIARGEQVDQCANCGLVMAKWEQQMKEEAENERIRRRMMRDQRNASDREADLERKRAELERLRERMAELMTELGIKQPGRFWRFFEKHPYSVASALGLFLIALSGFALYEVDKYMEAQELAALRAATPPPEARQIAPVVSAAVRLQQNGNDAMVSEIADVTTGMHASAPAGQKEILGAAEQMMKGVDADEFLRVASKSAKPGGMTLPGPDGQEPVQVNTDTIGGISGIRGIDRFEPRVLSAMAPPLLEHGQEQVLQTLTEEVQVPDPADDDVMLTIERVEDMDGSMIVDLLKTLGRDQEWDRFLAVSVGTYLQAAEFDRASNLIEHIDNPVPRIEALGKLMVRQFEDDPDVALKPLMNRVDSALAEMVDPDAKAKVLLELGGRLADAGHAEQPAKVISRVQEMIQKASDPFEKSYLSSRLAIAHLDNGEIRAAKTRLGAAVNLAGQLGDTAQRISAFSRIARRYHDAHNATVASEILGEAQILAATRLEPVDRSRVFGEIAISQGYMGDLAGAMTSIDNAGEGQARQQLMAKLAEFLIGLERYYDALNVMVALTDPIEFNRLQIRLITALHYAGESDQVRLRLEGAMASANRIESAAERGVVLSQLGRLARRAGFDTRAGAFFDAATAAAAEVDGRQRAITLGVIGLEQARALMRFSSQKTMYDVDEVIIKDTLASEIVATNRVIDNLMPASVHTRIEAEPEY